MQLQNSNLPALQSSGGGIVQILSSLGDLVPSVLAAPTPIVSTNGVTGSTTYAYEVAALSVNGQAVSAAVQTTTGNATLTSANSITILWGPVPNALGYAVYRTTGGGSQGLLAIVAANTLIRPAVGQSGLNAYFQLTDIGLSATAVSGNAPSTNTTGQVNAPGPIFSAQMILAAGQSTQAGTGATVTYSIANMLTPLLVRSAVNSSGSTDTTPTAAAMVAALAGVAVGNSYLWAVQNTTASAYTATVTAGSGVTVVGTATVAHLTTRLFLVQFTNVTPASEAVSITSLVETAY